MSMSIGRTRTKRLIQAAIALDEDRARFEETGSSRGSAAIKREHREATKDFVAHHDRATTCV